MYICNIGSCRAILCKTDESNVLRAIQLSVDHNINNEDEALRLSQLGLDVSLFKQSPFTNTRCIGCYSGKAGYKDSADLSTATTEPIISLPEIVGPINFDDSCRFLVLMSGGLCKTLQEIYANEQYVINRELVQSIVQQVCSKIHKFYFPFVLDTNYGFYLISVPSAINVGWRCSISYS